jgi:hypothetical protein
LLRTIAEPAAGPDEPGLILMAGTRGVLRRARYDQQEIAPASDAGREGLYMFARLSVGYAEVDFEEYIEWTASTRWDDELPRIERRAGGWTVLYVPLEYLAVDEPR